MARRRRPDGPNPTGPIDPWTGLPDTGRPSAITPMGQVDQIGLFADGLRRGPESVPRSKRWLVNLGVALITISALTITLVVLLGDHGS
jgi:hypothetical protein